MNQAMYVDRLLSAVSAKKTPCIAGLDPAISLMPAEFLKERGVTTESPRATLAKTLFEYCALVIDAVHDLVPAVKPQSAYFERYGAPGVQALEDTIAHAKSKGLIVILDVKRGDIGSTSEAYAEAYLGNARAGGPEIDCLTLNPYLGEDSLTPFFKVCEQTGRGVFVCVKTSNPGAAALQDLTCDGRQVFQVVAGFVRSAAERTLGASGYSGIGAVVGATYPETAQLLRRELPRSLFLVPGIGAQGGDIHMSRHSFNRDGLGAIVSSSRAINFPHLYGKAKQSGPSAIRAEMISMIDLVRKVLHETTA